MPKISELVPATLLDGSELVPIDQGLSTLSATVRQIVDFTFGSGFPGLSGEVTSPPASLVTTINKTITPTWLGTHTFNDINVNGVARISTLGVLIGVFEDVQIDKSLTVEGPVNAKGPLAAGTLAVGAVWQPLGIAGAVAVFSNSGVNTGVLLDNYSDTPASRGTLFFRRAGGTGAAPTAVVTDHQLGAVSAFGFDGSAYSSVADARIRFVAAENWVPGKHGSKIFFDTSVIGTANAPVPRLTIDGHGDVAILQGAVLGGAAGGSKGPGTVNALNYYKNGVLFTGGGGSGGGGGTITEIDTGVGLIGGPIVDVGTIALADTGVVPGQYSAANITVDQQGRITAAADGVGGGVTQVDTGVGLTGGPITGAGVIALADTAVVPGPYTNGSFTVDQQGRITSASDGPPSSGGTVTSVGAGTGLTGGPITTTGVLALSDILNNPGPFIAANITVDRQGRITAAANGPGGTVTSVGAGVGLTGGPITGAGALALSNTGVTPGPYTKANISVDAQGRITAAVNGTDDFNGTVTSVAAGTGLAGGPITTAGSLSLADTPVVPGSYTKANITIDQQGRITQASSGGTGPTPGADTIFASSVYLGGASGNLFPNFYVPASNPNGAGAMEGIGVVASLAANAPAVLQFNMPNPIAGGTLKLRCLAMSAGAGVAKFTVADGVASAGSNLGASSLHAEAQSTITTVVDVMNELKIPLFTQPTPGQIYTVLVTFNNAGWTLAQPSTWQFSLVWE